MIQKGIGRRRRFSHSDTKLHNGRVARVHSFNAYAHGRESGSKSHSRKRNRQGSGIKREPGTLKKQSKAPARAWDGCQKSRTGRFRKERMFQLKGCRLRVAWRRQADITLMGTDIKCASVRKKSCVNDSASTRRRYTACRLWSSRHSTA